MKNKKSLIANIFAFAILVSLFFISKTELQAQETNKRYVFLEHFTNTSCGICSSRNPTFRNNILDEYQDTEVIHVEYHPSVPYTNDVFYVQNPDENEARRNYYGVPGTPRLFIWGEQGPSGSQLLPVSSLEDILGQTASVGIDVEEVKDGANRTVNVNLTAFENVPAADWRLRVIVVERVIEQTTNNGETEHHNVFRKILNTWEGSSLSIVAGAETESFTFDYTLGADWQDDQIYAIAFLQRDDTKEVLNVGSSWNNQQFVGIGTKANEDIEFALSPNPAYDFLTIKYVQKLANNSILEIYDVAGVLVKQQQLAVSQNENVIAIDEFSEGVYIAVLKNENGSVAKRFVKTK
jgi:hypothetical protein